MTDNEFTLGLLADPMHTADMQTRVPYLVAAGLEQRAKELRKEGRPDKASHLRWIASRLNAGQIPTKGPINKCNKDIDVVRARLVDGIAIGRYPQ
jgi:hypothetical protein